ncbi:MAG: helix-turn-helix domain-containing protein [Clostridia bacterium]|nr:helix-turn-helix domain-containing protein [Clostridia bacterium]
MTCSQLCCLMEIKHLSEKTPGVASVSLSKSLKLSKPSVHRLLRGLKDMGLIEKEYYGEASLTSEGNALAEKMNRRIDALIPKLDGAIVKHEHAYNAALVLLSGLEEEKFCCFSEYIGEERTL